MPYIGIRCTYNDFDLRRELLLFDRIALPFLEATLRTWANTDDDALARELEWLAQRDVVFVPDMGTLAPGAAADAYRDYLDGKARSLAAMSAFGEFAKKKGFNTRDQLMDALVAYSAEVGGIAWFEELDRTSRLAYDDLARALAVHFTQDARIVALPIL